MNKRDRTLDQNFLGFLTIWTRQRNRTRNEFRDFVQRTLQFTSNVQNYLSQVAQREELHRQAAAALNPRPPTPPQPDYNVDDHEYYDIE